MNKKILIATEKPFAEDAIVAIKNVIEEAEGFELQLLEKYTDESELSEAISNAHGLVVRSDQVTDALMQAANELKIIVRAGSGYDNIDVESATKRDIVVMNTPGQNANAVAELTFGLMLSLIRNKYNGSAGTELRGKNIGMHGFGNIGKCMATIARGFNMDIFAFDPFIDQEVMKQHGVRPADSLGDLYQMCEFISINIPANEATLQSINYELLSQTMSNALLINTARKELINEPDLLRLIEERPEFLYASDVAPDCRAELEKNHPLRTKFTVKKMGAQTKEANINAGVAAVNQVIGFLERGDEGYRVN